MSTPGQRLQGHRAIDKNASSKTVGIRALEGPKMRNRFWVSMVVLSAAVVAISIGTSAQNNSKPTWPEVDWHKPRMTPQNRKPAPRRNIAGSWSTAGGPDAGTQAGGVQLKPNNGKPENA